MPRPAHSVQRRCNLPSSESRGRRLRSALPMPVMESWLLTHLTTFEVILTGAGSVKLGAILLFGGVIPLLERRKDGDPRELRNSGRHCRGLGSWDEMRSVR